MKNKLSLIISILTFTLSSFSARVAVTDSGTDFNHEWLKDKALINPADTAWNHVDDDQNKKVDDIYGWNFADNYSKVFFPEHLKFIQPRVFKIMDVLSRIQSGTQTKEDDAYWAENIKNLPQDKKQALLTELNFYGQYAHSTHVSGIIVSLSPDSRLMSNRIFPDMPMSSPIVPLVWNVRGSEKKWGLADFFYKLFAQLANGTFISVAQYIAEKKIDVANYSVGTSLKMIAGLALSLKGIKNPTDQQLAEESERIFKQYEPVGKKWISSAPNTLFVIAAGNDGSNNDQLPTFPANIDCDNSITVAATQGIHHLADFSNYGIHSVHVAAPGVAIKSSVPSLDNQTILPMSGTSMAAPYVTGVAAQIKDLNPSLTPSQIKWILMQTVDKKEWLKNKVISQGVVNPERAYEAARLSNSMSLDQAQQEARQKVVDQTEIVAPKRLFNISESYQEMKDFARDLVF